MCDVVTYLVGEPDPNGPFGAKEAGQGPLLPVMPAIANAIYDAVGVRIDEVPMSPPKVLKAIQAKATGKEPALRADQDAAGAVAGGDRVLTPGPGWEARKTRGLSTNAPPPSLHTRHFRPRSARPSRSASRPARRGAYVAGGTDLYPNMKRRQQTPRRVIDVRRIPELGRRRGGGRGTLVLGAGVTLTQLIRDPAVRAEWPVLAPPLRQFRRRSCRTWARWAATSCSTPAATTTTRASSGGRPSTSASRRTATPAGWRRRRPRCWAVQSSDLAPVMVALGAAVTLVGPTGERTIPASALYRNDGIEYLSKHPDELLARIEVPALAGARASVPQGAPPRGVRFSGAWRGGVVRIDTAGNGDLGRAWWSVRSARVPR